ncbi:MAG TPA: HdeD family acid-resistance protein [Longimicrobium sp.]|nr:HdeD family acid-resistance protein [Longimicrobium sp.]
MQIPVVEVDTLSRNWWAVALRGVCGILFGTLTFLAPGISLAALVLFYGAWALADGVLAIASAVRRRTEERWWVLVLKGSLGITAGVVTLFWPGITAMALLYVIAAWALVAGALEVAAAIRLRRVVTGEWLLALSGVLSIVLGVLLMLFPGTGALAVVLWIGAYALVSGALLVALALRLRARRKSGPPYTSLDGVTIGRPPRPAPHAK